MQFYTDRLIISPAGMESLEPLMDYFQRNRDFHRPWAPLHPDSWYELPAVTEQMKKADEGWAAGTSYRFWYARKEDPGHMIGHATLSNVVRGPFQSCNLGYSQDVDACGQGYMGEALRAILEFAFGEAGLHRVEANVIPENEASLAVLARLGFRGEGEARRYLRINGDWQDHLRFSILREEFLEQ